VSIRHKILRALQAGHRTNAQLQELCGTDGVDIGRTCWNLTREGRVIRVDGGGAGAKATCGLAPDAKPLPPEPPQRRNGREIEFAVAEMIDSGCDVETIARELSISVGWAKSMVAYLGASSSVVAGVGDKAIAAQTARLIAAIRRHHPERCLS